MGSVALATREVKMEWSEETKKHLMEHMDWPATGQEIMDQCSMMDHVPENERRMVMNRLDPNKTYDNMDEVMMDLEKEETMSNM